MSCCHSSRGNLPRNIDFCYVGDYTSAIHRAVDGILARYEVAECLNRGYRHDCFFENRYIPTFRPCHTIAKQAIDHVRCRDAYGQKLDSLDFICRPKHTISKCSPCNPCGRCHHCCKPACSPCNPCHQCDCCKPVCKTSCQTPVYLTPVKYVPCVVPCNPNPSPNVPSEPSNPGSQTPGVPDTPRPSEPSPGGSPGSPSPSEPGSEDPRGEDPVGSEDPGVSDTLEEPV